MAFQIDERMPPRKTFNPPTETREYVAEGETDQDVVLALAAGATPAFISTPWGLLYRQDIQLNPQGHDVYHISVPYAERKRVVGQFSISFDTTGGSAHIDNSGPYGGTQAIYTSTGPVPDGDRGMFSNAIGYQADDKIEGCDRVMPSLKLTVDFKHPVGVISIQQIKAIARATGCVASVPMLGFAAGEVLFLGATGIEGTDVETSVQYHFDCSENVQDIEIGDIVVVTKEGHDFSWVKYRPDKKDGAPTIKATHVVVERVYTRKNLPAILGFGA